jgi:hypothetical protein
VGLFQLDTPHCGGIAPLPERPSFWTIVSKRSKTATCSVAVYSNSQQGLLALLLDHQSPAGETGGCAPTAGTKKRLVTATGYAAESEANGEVGVVR